MMPGLPGMGGATPAAPTTYHAHPGADHRMGCPNCGGTEQLVIDVPMTMHHRVEVYGIDGVTEPEFDVVDSDEVDTTAPITNITKVRCLACRWAFTGQQPLTKLARQ